MSDLESINLSLKKYMSSLKNKVRFFFNPIIMNYQAFEFYCLL